MTSLFDDWRNLIRSNREMAEYRFVALGVPRGTVTSLMRLCDYYRADPEIYKVIAQIISRGNAGRCELRMILDYAPGLLKNPKITLAKQENDGPIHWESLLNDHFDRTPAP